MKTRKTKLLALSLILTLLISVAPVLPAAAAGEFTASFGAQMDPVNGWELGEIAEASFDVGGEATITIEFDEPVSFGDGNYAAVDTNAPYADYSGDIVSFKLDGNEIAMGAAFLSDEGPDKGLRLTLCNKWNDNIGDQPVDVEPLGEFTKIEITFIVNEGGSSPVSGVADIDLDAEYEASFGAQFDEDVTDINGWEIGDPAKTTFKIGEEAVIAITFDEIVKFGENYASIDTNVPFTGSTGEIISFKLDGNEIAMGAAFESDEGPGKGLRLTLCNKWNSDIDEQPVDVALLDEFTTIELTFIVRPFERTPVEKPKTGGDFDPNGTYNAYLGIQMDNWIFRDAWDSPLGDPNGPNGSSWADFDQPYFDHLFHTTDAEIKKGTITDAEIKGNGTYRVSVVDWDFEDAESFNQLYVSTNIPYTEDLVFTDVKVIIGGNSRHTFRDGYVFDDTDYIQIGAINIWSDDLKELFNDSLPAGGEIAIEFTVSGFAYDNTDTAAPPDNSGNDNVDPASPSPATGDDEDEGGGNGLMIGLIIGGLVLIAVIVVVVMKKKN